MTEKDNVSIATVQMKADYAPSEVYSTASEPPPAYKRQANSVKIAKIVAYTIIASCTILGTFILASTYLQARASCDQVQALDSVLEKELVLETLQQVNREVPKAESLIGAENENNLEKNIRTEEKHNGLPMSGIAKDNESSDSSFSDSEESIDMKSNHKQVPVDLDLTDLAAAILQNNQKSKMNCVVERKRIVEDVDRPARTVALPFGVNLQMDPKKAQITGERIAIFCDRGDEEKVESKRKSEVDDEDSNEENDIESMRPMFIPQFPMRIPYGRIPQQNPLTHMPQIFQAQNNPFRPTPFQFRPPIPAQFMQPPQQAETEPERPQTAHLRIQVQQLPIREVHMAQDIPVQISSNSGSDRREMPNAQRPQIQIQRVPLGIALQRAGITADDLRNIQRMAEEKITEELRRFANDESNSSEYGEDNSNENSDSQSTNRVTFPSKQALPLLPIEQQSSAPKETVTAPDNIPIIPIGRSAFGRSLQHPVNIPISIIQQSEEPTPQSSELKQHIVQPRSVE
ncbi:hypothetical protein ACFFRR_011930 [Megaselia abdita]